MTSKCQRMKAENARGYCNASRFARGLCTAEAARYEALLIKDRVFNMKTDELEERHKAERELAKAKQDFELLATELAQTKHDSASLLRPRLNGITSRQRPRACVLSSRPRGWLRTRRALFNKRAN
jgi:hypothetical protein